MRSAKDANRSYFREAYATGRHGWAVDEPDPHVVSHLRKLAERAPGGALLDVGCGEGRHSFAAAQLGFRVTGIDYEPGAVRRARRFARERGVTGVAFRRADVFDLPFADDAFNVVLDFGCLHHQRKRDWSAYRASILRVLMPGGHYVLTVFSPRFRLFRGARRPWHIAQGAYRRCFSRADIRDLFGRGFRILEASEEHGGASGFWHVLMRKRAGPPVGTDLT